MDDFRKRLMKMLTGGGGHNLPPEYQEVSYIDNHNGGAYILPELTLSGADWGLRVVCKFKQTDSYQAIISVGGWYQNSLYLGASNSRNINLQGLSSMVNLNDYRGSEVDIEANFKNSGVISINGVTVATNVSAKNQTRKVYLLAMFYGSATIGTGCRSEVKEISFSSGSEVTRDLVPCYRKVDNVRGMYDLSGSICPLTGTPFYVNAGAGEFIVGQEII